MLLKFVLSSFFLGFLILFHLPSFEVNRFFNFLPCFNLGLYLLFLFHLLTLLILNLLLFFLFHHWSFEPLLVTFLSNRSSSFFHLLLSLSQKLVWMLLMFNLFFLNLDPMFHLFSLQVYWFVFFDLFFNHLLLDFHLCVKNQFFLQSVLHFFDSTPFIKLHFLIIRNIFHVIIIMLLKLFISVSLDVNHGWYSRLSFHKPLYVLILHPWETHIFFIQQFRKICPKRTLGYPLPNYFIDHVQGLSGKLNSI